MSWQWETAIFLFLSPFSFSSVFLTPSLFSNHFIYTSTPTSPNPILHAFIQTQILARKDSLTFFYSFYAPTLSLIAQTWWVSNPCIISACLFFWLNPTSDLVFFWCCQWFSFPKIWFLLMGFGFSSHSLFITDEGMCVCAQFLNLRFFISVLCCCNFLQF